jgi:hypothetical protein
VPRDSRTVYASFGKTWDAVIDVFASQNIPISTMERASGFIAAERTSWRLASLFDRDYVLRLSDCGRYGPNPYLPTAALYNIVVRGDGSASTVKVTTTYTSTGAFYTNPTRISPTRLECTSRGVFEDSVEVTIKQHAEAFANQTVRAAERPQPVAPPPAPSASTPVVRPMNVTVRIRLVDPDSTVTPVPNFAIAVIGDRGDTTRVTTNTLGIAGVALPPGRYRAVAPKRADFEGKLYEWDVPFTVRMGMGPVDLTQRNAKVMTAPR